MSSRSSGSFRRAGRSTRVACRHGRLSARQFVAGGFTEWTQRTVEQRMTDGPEEYRERVRARGFSSLHQISDEAFARGLAQFEAWSGSLPADEPVHERVDVFVFRR